MTNTIQLNNQQTVLKSAVVGIQVEEYTEATDKFGLFLGVYPEVDEIKVLLIGGNSVKFTVPKGEGLGRRDRIIEQLGWN
jgi:hypothetical protein